MKQKTPLTIVIPDIRSALNIGAIFRTADAINAHKIYLSGYSATPKHPKVAKTALGAENTVEWDYEKDTIKLLKRLKAEGNTLYALELTKQSECLWDTKIKFPAVLIIGNEIKGVCPEILTICDQVVHLPMLGSKESLNVATATGITMYSFLQEFTCKEQNN